MEDTPPRQEALMAASKLISPCGSLGAAANITRQPAPIVLDKFAWIGGRMNRDTIATVESDDGHILEVSFWIHEPPALSYFCIHYRRAPNSKPNDADFEDEPHVVAAEGRFDLLRTSFVSSSGADEYFMYKVSNGESGKLASLDRLPHPSSFRLPTLEEFGIVPRGDHYLVAALCLGFDMLYYELNIYSSEDETWTSKLLQNPCPQFDKVITSKVVTLGEGIIGWVDFQHGMLVCNLHETNPTARYIPLPDPLLPENKDKLEALHPGPSARIFRDLACVNGVLKFIDMEHLEVTTQKPSYPLNSGKLYDSDVFMSRERKEPKALPSYNGWKALMWSRTLSSNFWEMGPVLDAADIMLDNSMNFSLLSGLMGEADIDKIAFKDLYSAYPTLSTDGDGNDILYLESLSKPNNLDERMVVLDLGTKRVKALGEYSLQMHSPSVKAVGPCTAPHVTTGKVPASAYISIKQAHISERDPNNTSICADHPSSCGSDNKRPRLS